MHVKRHTREFNLTCSASTMHTTKRAQYSSTRTHLVNKYLIISQIKTLTRQHLISMAQCNDQAAIYIGKNPKDISSRVHTTITNSRSYGC